MNSDRKQFIRLANPRVSDDGGRLEIRVEMADGDGADLDIPLTELSELVSFLAAVGNHIAGQNAVVLDRPAHGGVIVNPISIIGLGFAVGPTPDQTTLLVRLPLMDLGFALESRQLAELSDEIGRIARTLSASPQGRH